MEATRGICSHRPKTIFCALRLRLRASLRQSGRRPEARQARGEPTPFEDKIEQELAKAQAAAKKT
jgi:hypothetical protein